ncbi:MAG: hypothetical protein KQJ78_07580 [Deltaproteobacteria bacterium]|nr:hypothetical protein [Deltaproteobacteria bacterium]
MDKNALSYWFPKLEAAGLPVPKTIIVPMPELAQKCLWAALDGKDLHRAEAEKFFLEISRAANQVGLPCFLRTDHTSGKHGWQSTCYLHSTAVITGHVYSIVEYSVMAGLVGLPWDTWAVREMLPTKPFGVCPRYGNMPICREFRFFVQDARVVCFHPYWPREALEQGRASADLAYEELTSLNGEDLREIMDLASSAGRAVGGAWSVDILDTARGWFITDMAEAELSWHWPGCAEAALGGLQV